MPEHDPVTMWVDQLRNADVSAVGKIWNHFAHRLCVVASCRLRPDSRSIYDEEDAAQSAFFSFCAGVTEGRFPDLEDRDSLWRLLLTITARKVSRRHRFDHQQRRDVRRNVRSAIFAGVADGFVPADLDRLPSPEPSPEFAAEFVDLCKLLAQQLDNPALQEVATLRLQGYADDEIAARLECSRRTVQRRLEVIRRQCQKLVVGGY